MPKNELVFSFRPTGHGNKVESKILTALQDQSIKGGMWTILIMHSLKLHLMEQRLCACLIHVFKDVHFCSEFNLFSFCIVLRAFNLHQRIGDVLFIWCDNHSNQTLIKWSIIIKLRSQSGILCAYEEFHKIITYLLSTARVRGHGVLNLN